MVDDHGCDGEAALGAARRLRRDVQCPPYIAALETRRPRHASLPGVLKFGLGTMRVVGEHASFEAELIRQVPDQEVGRDLVVPQPEARMTQQRQMAREPNRPARETDPDLKAPLRPTPSGPK